MGLAVYSLEELHVLVACKCHMIPQEKQREVIRWMLGGYLVYPAAIMVCAKTIGNSGKW